MTENNSDTHVFCKYCKQMVHADLWVEHREVCRVAHQAPKVKRPGRNDPCPCRSGKKYKHCRLRNDQRAHHANLVAQRQQAILAAEQALQRAKEAQAAADSVVAELFQSRDAEVQAILGQENNRNASTEDEDAISNT